MAKFRKNELSKKEIEELLLDFAVVLANIKQPKEAVQFIRDLMSEQEARMFAKRLKIAALLLSGKIIPKYHKVLGVIVYNCKINAWLQEGGEGYRLMIARLKARRNNEQCSPDIHSDFPSIRRRYPAYYWPSSSRSCGEQCK